MGRKPRLSRSSNRTADNRLRRAEDKVERARSAYEDFGLELEDELRAIQEEWRDYADEVEAVQVGLESDDITVGEIRLVWVRR